MPPPSRVILRWSAYEHEHIERGTDWYWALGIIAVCAALLAILFHDLLFGVVILCAAWALSLVAQTPPQLSTFELSERGIRINGTMHRFDEIISFWVDDEPHHMSSAQHHRPFLLIDTVKFMSPNFVIPIEGIDPHAVRAFMKRRSKEVHMKEPIYHKIVEFLGL